LSAGYGLIFSIVEHNNTREREKLFLNYCTQKFKREREREELMVLGKMILDTFIVEVELIFFP